jgi:hypothetical protein
LCENFNKGEEKGYRTKTETDGVAVTTIGGHGFDSRQGQPTATVQVFAETPKFYPYSDEAATNHPVCR